MLIPVFVKCCFYLNVKLESKLQKYYGLRGDTSNTYLIDWLKYKIIDIKLLQNVLGNIIIYNIK